MRTRTSIHFTPITPPFTFVQSLECWDNTIFPAEEVSYGWGGVRWRELGGWGLVVGGGEVVVAVVVGKVDRDGGGGKGGGAVAVVAAVTSTTAAVVVVMVMAYLPFLPPPSISAPR